MQAMSAFERGDLVEATARANEAFAAAGASEELLVQRAGTATRPGKRGRLARRLRGRSAVVRRGDRRLPAEWRDVGAWDPALGGRRPAHRAGTSGAGPRTAVGSVVDLPGGRRPAGHRLEPRRLCRATRRQRTHRGKRAIVGGGGPAARTVGGALAPEIRWIRARYLESARTSLGAPTSTPLAPPVATCR